MTIQNQRATLLLVLTLLVQLTHSFTFINNKPKYQTSALYSSSSKSSEIISPFSEDGSATSTTGGGAGDNLKLKDGVTYDLTEENVELVLDSMRSFLIADGGNVALVEIDGPVVKLELQVCYVMLKKNLLFRTELTIQASR